MPLPDATITITIGGLLDGRPVQARWSDGQLHGDETFIRTALLARRTTRSGRQGTVLDDLPSAIDALLAALDRLTSVEIGESDALHDRISSAHAAYDGALEANGTATGAGQRSPVGAGAVAVLRHRLVSAIAEPVR